MDLRNKISFLSLLEARLGYQMNPVLNSYVAVRFHFLKFVATHCLCKYQRYFNKKLLQDLTLEPNMLILARFCNVFCALKSMILGGLNSPRKLPFCEICGDSLFVTKPC